MTNERGESWEELRLKAEAYDRLFEGDPPDPALYLSSEQFVAGALSTMPPFSSHHPAYALPFARRAIEALAEWTPEEPQREE